MPMRAQRIKKLIPYIYPCFQGYTLKFLDAVQNSSKRNIATGLTWMFSFGIKMFAKQLVLAKRGKSASQDWLSLTVLRFQNLSMIKQLFEKDQ